MTKEAVKKIRIPKATVFTSPLIILLGASLNILFWWLSNDVLKTPIFMDSLFTAVIAALYGPVLGTLTGLFTNLEFEALAGFPGVHWPFALCNMATGLIVGLRTRNRDCSLTGLNVTVTIVLVVIANSILGTLIAMIVFSGDTEVSLDYIISTLTEVGQSLFVANFWARILTNLIDKMIAIYTAFGIRALFRDPSSQKLK